MKQVLRKGFKDIVVDEVPDPVVTPHHLLIRPHVSLISSGTETASIHPDVIKVVAENPSHIRKIVDIAKVEGPVQTAIELKAKFSSLAVLGYSGAGVVIEKHKSVAEFEIGDRVAYGGEGTGHGETILAGRNLTVRVPAGLPFEQAAFATLGSIAMNAVRTANTGLGETVVVIGLGLVGQLTAQLARLQGAVVIGVDLKPDRVDLAKRMGADHGVTDSIPETVLSLTNGRGADCVIVAAAAKSSAPCTQALKLCRDRGRIVVVGAVELNFPWLDMYLKEIQLLMSRAYGPGSYDPNYEVKGQDYPIGYIRWTENRNMEEFLRLCAAGRVNVEPLISHRYLLDQAPTAYETIMNPVSGSLAVVLRYPEADRPASTPEVLRRRIDLPGIAPVSKTNLNVALVGAAGIARWSHVPVLKKISGVDLRAVYSSNGARGKTHAQRYGAAYCTSDYNEILKDPDIDIALIVGRNQGHAPQSLEAIRAGKHVFVEKPMALTVEECRDLVHEVAQTGRHLTVGFNRRFAPFYVEQKRRIARRAGPAVINCRVNSPGISGDFWMADPAIGGAILGEAVHFIDLMYWLLESEPVRVSAFSLPTRKKDPIGENNIVASFQFADGSIGNLTYCTIGGKTSQGERVEVFAQGIGVTTNDFKQLSIHT
ncbi:MAG: bi-domain-containing oxidoreductase [Acidobacteriota bacterium]|nr:bi-domain-containing oxidoreductase [Acidobacteriota bacterium]